jgi:hypothetical protein
VEAKKRTSRGSGRKKTSVSEKLSKIPFDLEKVRKIAAFYGNTDAQLASILGVSEDTINVWKKDKSFFQALKEAKAEADSRVVESLYARATGYSHNAIHFSAYEGVVTETPYVEHYPPDPTSMIFWLKNRDKENWRDRHDFTSDGEALKGGTLIIDGKTITQA